MNLPESDNNTISNQNNFELDFFKKTNIFLFFGIIFFIAIGYFLLISPPKNFPKGIIVAIEKGDTLREISFELKEKYIIRSRVSFEAFAILFGAEKNIFQGDYLFEDKLPVFKVARQMAKKDRHLASLKITIPEGFDLLQIANIASAKLRNFNKENFLSKAKEGYLFPDTYFFFSSDNEEDVLKYMALNFENKIKLLKDEIVSSGRTENEIITMASLIEREAKGDQDREYISGILWSRLNKGMPLQVDSAMDTYKTKGLPVEPICNPGLEAIKASIHPVKSNFLYYLHDQNGVIHYAKTFEEHKRNKVKYLKN